METHDLREGWTRSHFVLGKVGLTLATVHPSASLVWVPAGIALAAVLILGRWVWPAISSARSP